MTNTDSSPSNSSGTGSSVRDRIFWSVLMVVAIADVVTKRWYPYRELILGIEVAASLTGL